MRLKISLFFLILLVTLSGNGQGSAIGKWKSYFPFNNVIDVVVHDKITYGITRNALIIRDFNDGSIERLTEVNALSDVGLSAIGYNVANKAIIVGYENGNVDVIINNVTTNLFQIRKSGLIGDKTINNIYCKGDFAYLSCGFGIVVFDIKKKEVKDTYIIGPGASQLGINQVVISNGVIYAGTKGGLFSANENSAFLTDFNSWIKSTTVPNFNNEISSISTTANSLVVSSVNSVSSDSLFIFKGGNWLRVSGINSGKINSVSSFTNTIMVNQFDTIFVLDTNLVIVKTLTNYDIFWRPKCNMIQYDGNFFYTADKENAIVRIKDNFETIFEIPRFMYSTNVLDIEVEDGQLWGSTGAVVGGGWNKTYSNDGAFHYDIREDVWTQYNIHTQGGDFCFPDGSSNCMNDLVGMAVNPNDAKKGYVCSFSTRGIAVLGNNTVLSAYDSTNSSMRISNVHNDRYAIKDATFDEDNNLWAVNSWVQKPLLLKTESGTWKSFNCGLSNQDKITASVTVDKLNGYKWIIFKDDRIVVYNDNGTLLDETDDEFREISKGTAGNNLGSAPVSIAEDKDGEMWIGTDQGIYVFYTPSEIFSTSNFSVEKIKVTLEGNVELLLENERVTCITIDGGNRKWIGTEGSGIFVLSPDGISQLLGFTTENSPLLSNNINDIAIDGETGEVFISTDRGLISYKGEATEPQDAFIDVYAYPNPVKPGYSGKIAIKGLVADSDVRITDIAGNVVFNTVSIGGQAIWNGNKLDGIRASSGIYLVFMTAPDGSSKQVTKILFMN